MILFSKYKILGLVIICSFWAKVPVYASDLLAEIEKSLWVVKKNHEFRANFSQKKKVAGFQKALESAGYLEVSAPGYAQWHVETPALMIAKISPDEIALIVDPQEPSKNKKFPINSQMASGGDFIWMQLINFDKKAIQNNFQISKNSKGLYELIPKKSSGGIQSMIFQLNRKGFFKKVIIVENPEDTIEITFSDPILKGH